MAIRYRLPSSGAAAVSPATQSYSHTQTTRRPLPTSDSSALATQAYTPDGADHLVAGDAHHIQFVSDALAANLRFSSGQAFKYAVQGLEAHTNNNLTIQVWAGIYSGDGSTLLATIRSKVADNTELATALTNRFFSGTLSGDYTTVGGERLVVEFSVVGTPAATSGTQGHNASLRWGSAGAGGDLPENDSSTGTTLNPWIEFDPVTIAPLAGTGQSTPERGVTTGISLVVGAAPGRATIARAAAAVLLTTVALSGAGRTTPARGLGDLTVQPGGTPAPLEAVGRITATRDVTQGIGLVVAASPGRATPARDAGTIVQTTALASVGRSTPARDLGDLTAAGIAELAGSGRATPATGLGGLTTRVALAGIGRSTPASDRGQLQMQGTTVSLASTGRSSPARGVSAGITLVAGASPGRATSARGRGELTVTGGGTVVSLAAIGRITPTHGIIGGELIIHLPVAAGRATPARGSGQLVTMVALTATGRPTPARGSALLSMASGNQQLTAIGRATPARGIASLSQRVALSATDRATAAREMATLRTAIALSGVGRATSSRGVAQLTLQPFTQPLIATGRATPVRGSGRLTGVAQPGRLGPYRALVIPVIVQDIRPLVIVRDIRPDVLVRPDDSD